MAAREEQREQATERLAAHLLATGLSQTSLRQLARAAGVSDRMLLYYFNDKAEALEGALWKIAGDLTGLLEASLPTGVKLAPEALLKETTGLVTDERTKPFFRLWTELVAAAARAEAPFKIIVANVAEGFLGGIDSRLDVQNDDARRATAAMILAMIDGLALLEICAGEERAGIAARQMHRLKLRD